MRSAQKELWIEAERKEIESIQIKKVVQPAPLLRGKKLLRTKWVCTESSMGLMENGSRIKQEM